MSGLPTTIDNFSRVVKYQALRIWEDALYCSAGHFQESRWWEGVNLWMGIPTTIIAAITGITSLSDSGNSSALSAASSSMIIPLLAFTVAALSGLSTFLDPKGQASKHYHAASEYQALVNDIQLFCQIDCEKGNNLEQLEDNLRKFNARLNKLNDQPIVISKRAKRIAEKEIKAGNYKYEIDKEIQKSTK